LLLTIAENELREGNVRDARRLFRAIVDRYPPSLERLAASSYLRSVSGTRWPSAGRVSRA
jgi:TolA-binding protein